MALSNLHWYVMRSKYRSELLLWQQLRSRSIEVYCPCMPAGTLKQPTQKVRPYFPGYMFIHTDLEVMGRSTLQWMPGGMGLVCFGGEPAYVSDGILHGIRERVDRMNSTRAWYSDELKPGEEVEIYTGLFAGYRGLFGSYLSDRDRATVFLRFVRDQQLRVELPVAQIVSSTGCQSRL